MHLKLSSHMAKSWGKTDLFSSSQITWHQRVAGMNAWLARTSPATYPAIVRHSGLSLSHTETGETGEMLLQTVKLKATYSHWQQEQLCIPGPADMTHDSLCLHTCYNIHHTQLWWAASPVPTHQFGSPGFLSKPASAPQSPELGAVQFVMFGGLIVLTTIISICWGQKNINLLIIIHKELFANM